MMGHTASEDGGPRQTVVSVLEGSDRTEEDLGLSYSLVCIPDLSYDPRLVSNCFKSYLDVLWVPESDRHSKINQIRGERR